MGSAGFPTTRGQSGAALSNAGCAAAVITNERKNVRMVLNKQGICAYSLLLVTLASGGCSTLTRGPAVPHDSQDKAGIPGLPVVRTWGDQVSPDFHEHLMQAAQRRQEDRRARGMESEPVAALAVSGGGANGAFGAGLLCGWTQHGDRPEFIAVTGISTGALIAPFAYLGPSYDHVLREVYTTTSTASLLKKRGMVKGFFMDALTDNGPMWKLMAKHVNQKMLDDIAAEYGKGRLLLIGTVNLDARRSVIWDIGAIAASKHPKSVQLVHSILIASASIPAAFPPVMIDVQADGHAYQEMHVDGGCLNEVFLYPTSYTPIAPNGDEALKREVYIIRNSRVDPDWGAVERRTLKIAGRAISALIHSQGLGDLDRMFMTARRDNMDFNLAHIPADFDLVPNEPFDREYMQKLFAVGFNLAAPGYPWAKLPPGYVEVKQP